MKHFNQLIDKFFEEEMTKSYGSLIVADVPSKKVDIPLSKYQRPSVDKNKQLKIEYLLEKLNVSSDNVDEIVNEKILLDKSQVH